MLYRLSYLGAPVKASAPHFCTAMTCGALGTMATLMGLEPTTFAVTGRRSNQLSYSANADTARPGVVGTVGIEPTTPRV